MGRDRYKRKSTLREQNSSFLIISEGRITEQDYFDAVRRSRRMRNADVRFIPPGPTSPIEIVNTAIEEREKVAKNAPYKAAWCIFDVESRRDQAGRDGLDKALTIAQRNNICIALSNPCFELWVLLHQSDQNSHLFSEEAQRACQKQGLMKGKNIIDADYLITQYERAKTSALNLERRHDSNKIYTQKDRNPSSTVFKLVDLLCSEFPPR